MGDKLSRLGGEAMENSMGLVPEGLYRAALVHRAKRAKRADEAGGRLRIKDQCNITRRERKAGKRWKWAEMERLTERAPLHPKKGGPGGPREKRQRTVSTVSGRVDAIHKGRLNVQGGGGEKMRNSTAGTMGKTIEPEGRGKGEKKTRVEKGLGKGRKSKSLKGEFCCLGRN